MFFSSGLIRLASNMFQKAYALQQLVRRQLLVYHSMVSSRTLFQLNILLKLSCLAWVKIYQESDSCSHSLTWLVRLLQMRYVLPVVWWMKLSPTPCQASRISPGWMHCVWVWILLHSQAHPLCIISLSSFETMDLTRSTCPEHHYLLVLVPSQKRQPKRWVFVI